jgi:hypothetical protein
MPKFIVVSGGVISGLGKGVLTASIAKILQSHGLKVIPLKIDGYVNVDAGTMSPFEHGECFVTDDGMETDQDLGTYERFLAIDLPAGEKLPVLSVHFTTRGGPWRAVGRLTPPGRRAGSWTASANGICPSSTCGTACDTLYFSGSISARRLKSFRPITLARAFGSSIRMWIWRRGILSKVSGVRVSRATVAAGRGGLNKAIQWVHVVDVPEMAEWVREGVLLFTTAFGIKDRPELQNTLIPDLVKVGVVGMVVAVGHYFHDIPEAMLRQADARDFPLLTWP